MAADGGSNRDGNKRRLQLMPEILPAPKQPNAKGSVRDRTVKTKDRLIALAAASAIMAGAAAVSGCGYGVVDPLPSPSSCPDVLSTITATAKWKLDNNQFVIVVEFSVPGQADAAYKDVDPQVTGDASFVSRALVQGALTVTILPKSGATVAYVHVPVHCTEGDTGVGVNLHVEGVTPVDGAAVTVTLYETSVF